LTSAVSFIYDNYRHLVISNIDFYSNRLELYNERINNKIMEFNNMEIPMHHVNICGFIDATTQEIANPIVRNILFFHFLLFFYILNL
jgi:hypothetical protein